jgi:hypothetical protein
MKAVSHSPALSEVMAILRAAKLEEHAVSTEKLGPLHLEATKPKCSHPPGNKVSIDVLGGIDPRGLGRAESRELLLSCKDMFNERSARLRTPDAFSSFALQIRCWFHLTDWVAD